MAPPAPHAPTTQPAVAMDPAVAANARQMLDEGRRVFRYETFGDEAYWGDTLKLHRAIAGAKLGGVGPGVSPKTALSVGLKVDVDAVPAAVAAALKAGQVDLGRSRVDDGPAQSERGRRRHRAFRRARDADVARRAVRVLPLDRR